jgi:zinc transport system permease protein
MLDDFLIRAVLAGVGLSLATGPLGAFVVWRRMAYFGDAMSHAAVLGVALALGFSISVTAGTLVVALAMGLAVASLVDRGHGMDAILGVLAHSALALGLVAISFVQGVRVDMTALLFGDILTVTKTDLAVIWGGSILVLALLLWRWAPLLTATLNEELAASAGIDPRRERLALTLALAVVVALALKLVGALLIAALLIIPAAAARGFGRTPEAMAAISVAFSMASVAAGVWVSFLADTPTGPSIVVAAAGLFVLSLAIGRGRHNP